MATNCAHHLLKDLLRSSEGIMLEFKAHAPTFSNKPWDCTEIATSKFRRTVVAMYNTPNTSYSGFIVYGVWEDPKTGIKTICGTSHVDDSNFHSALKHSFNVIAKLEVLDINVHRSVLQHWDSSFVFHDNSPDNFHFIVIKIDTGPKREGPCVPIKLVKSNEKNLELTNNAILIRRQSSNEYAEINELVEILKWFRRIGHLAPSLHENNILWTEMANHLHHFVSSRNYMLVTALPGCSSSEWSSLRMINWTAILDCDPDSNTKGLKSVLMPALQKRGRTVINHPPTKKIDHGFIRRDTTYWLSTHDQNSAAQIHFLPEAFHALYPSLTTIIVLCNSPEIGNSVLLGVLMQCRHVGVEVILVQDLRGAADDNFWSQFQIPILASSFPTPPFPFPYKEFGSLVNRICPPLPGRVSFPRGYSRVPSEIFDDNLLHSLQADWELVHFDIGTLPSDRDQEMEASDFFLGWKPISWKLLSMGNVAVRRGLQDAIESALIQDLKTVYPVEKIIAHEPGAGGTTLARQVAYSLRTRCPCLFLKPDTKLDFRKTASLIARMNREFELCVLLVGEMSAETSKGLLSELSRNNVTACLLRVERRLTSLRSTTTTTAKLATPIEPFKSDQHRCHEFKLNSRLDRTEAIQFFHRYNKLDDGLQEHDSDKESTQSEGSTDSTGSIQCPSFATAYGKNETEFIQRHQADPHDVKFSPFLFPLFRFHAEFQGLTRFVERWKASITDERYLTVARLIAFVQCYRTRDDGCFPDILFARILNQPKWTGSISDVLPTHIRELIVEPRTGYWRFVHPCIAQEFFSLSNCNAESLAKELLRLVLDENANEKYIVQTLMHEIFSERRRDPQEPTEGKKEAFPRLIMELEPDIALEILQTAADKLQSSVLMVQIARLLCFRLQQHDNAMAIIDELLQQSPNDSNFHHVKGMIERARLSAACWRPGYEERSILEIAKRASASFETSRKLQSNNVHAYMAEIQMIIMLIRFLSCTKFNREPKDFLISLQQNVEPYIRSCLFRGTGLLSLVDQKVPGAKDAHDFFLMIFDSWCRNGERLDGATQDDQINLVDPRLTVLIDPDMLHWRKLQPTQKAITRAITKIEQVIKTLPQLQTTSTSQHTDTASQCSPEEVDTLFMHWLRVVRLRSPPLSLRDAREIIEMWYRCNPTSPGCSFYRYVIYYMISFNNNETTSTSQEAEQLLQTTRSHNMKYSRKIRERVIKRTESLSCLSDEDGKNQALHIFGQDKKHRAVITKAQQPNQGEIQYMGLPIYFMPKPGADKKGEFVTFALGFSFWGPQALQVQPTKRPHHHQQQQLPQSKLPHKPSPLPQSTPPGSYAAVAGRMKRV